MVTLASEASFCVRAWRVAFFPEKQTNRTYYPIIWLDARRPAGETYLVSLHAGSLCPGEFEELPLEEQVFCIRVMSTAAAKALLRGGGGTDGGELSCSSESERDHLQERMDEDLEPCLYLAHIMTCLLWWCASSSAGALLWAPSHRPGWADGAKN